MATTRSFSSSHRRSAILTLFSHTHTSRVNYPDCLVSVIKYDFNLVLDDAIVNTTSELDPCACGMYLQLGEGVGVGGRVIYATVTGLNRS